jgi:threonine/homoserine/homoserine lactone efflux protein
VDTTVLTVFVAASLLMGVTPGPAVLYIVTRTFDQGRAAGVASALGVAIGTLAHIAAAVLGVSALLAASTTAFNVVKYAGAAYLVYLGVRKILERSAAAPDAALHAHPRRQPAPLGKIMREAMLVNVLNPKTGLFFLAFLPQFVHSGAALSPQGQIVILGLVFMLCCLVTDTAFALVAASAGGWLRAKLAVNPRVERGQRYVIGSIYVGLGAATALAGRLVK